MSKTAKKTQPESEVIDRIDYERKLATFEALREEAAFILKSELDKAGIKTHSVESRVKEFDSLSRKVASAGKIDWEAVNDIVGVRVICLFKSDLERIDSIISKIFSVKRTDNKIDQSTDTFGYMSVHYECEMRPEYHGPRYDSIRGMDFEVQVRTICMHAWAAISHYLEYKADWDIPTGLKKGLNALSGLFFVADEQYESLYRARMESRESANAVKNISRKEEAINLDTFGAYLRQTFPDRVRVDYTVISLLIRSIKDAGYKTIDQLDADIKSGLDWLHKHERDIAEARGSKPPFFYDAAAVRVILTDTNEKFRQADMLNSTFSDDDLTHESNENESSSRP